ncbi:MULTISPECIES: DUF6560 family protein [unclassified Actinobaculum]|uniref:DUF6560 family protein n=1 Tax=unclassified Actinobaculum TaxID=2609299 RepID=UPI000D5260C5|nr:MULTISPECIES: DUF6560 family protein [unclassified Actinobaculum]AWE41903.1 hypothetical protein DDD63_03070 [Actinobaculum sp. 313]RTE50182.1 hypothetical protein EKN07_02890 [Actinobaculum sp. 352]
MDKILFRILIILLVVGITYMVSMLTRRRPNRSAKDPSRIRQPRLIIVIGILFLLIGLLFVAVALTAANDGDDAWIGMFIAGLAMMLTGLFFAILYRNWWISVGDDAIDFSTAFGRRKRIRYADITTYRVISQYGNPQLTVVSSDGTTLSLNKRSFDVSALEIRHEFAQQYGHWPNPAELQNFLVHRAGLQGHVSPAGPHGSYQNPHVQPQVPPTQGFGAASAGQAPQRYTAQQPYVAPAQQAESASTVPGAANAASLQGKPGAAQSFPTQAQPGSNAWGQPGTPQQRQNWQRPQSPFHKGR